MIQVSIETKKHTSYKPSGLKWIKEIPSHWDIQSFRNILSERNEKNDPVRSTERLSLSIDKGITLYSEKTTNLDRFKDDFNQYKLAHKNDLVFNSMNMIVGAVGVSDYFGCVSPVYYTYSGKINSTKYYEYLFRCKTIQRFLYSLGKGLMAIDRGDGKYNTLRLKVSRDDLKSLKLPVPSVNEQENIVQFLNEKTAKIDKAIAQKEKLIELLKERKQIIIQNAVTNGLDSNAKMKPSGIDWIGDIPEHWEVKKLKFLLNEYNVRSSTGEEVLLSLSKYKGVIPKSSLEERAGGAENHIGYKQVKSGHLVINKMQAVNGLLAVSALEGITSPDYSVYYSKSNHILVIDYLEKLLLHVNYLAEFKKRVTGVMEGFIRLYTNDLYDISVHLPPINEQKEIMDYIVKVSKQIDLMIHSNESKIEKLIEYKSVLIDNAVTGKIKVC